MSEDFGRYVRDELGLNWVLESLSGCHSNPGLKGGSPHLQRVAVQTISRLAVNCRFNGLLH